MENILFVCTGNTCRSIMAEVIFKHMLKNREDELKDIRVSSAGTCAWEGDQVSPKAVEALGERGIYAKDYTSIPLTPKLVKEADLILTMTLNHKAVVLHMWPEAEKKVYTLKEYVLNDFDKLYISDSASRKEYYDIKDPYGQPVETYQKSAKEIEEHLQMLIEKLVQMKKI